MMYGRSEVEHAHVMMAQWPTNGGKVTSHLTAKLSNHGQMRMHICVEHLRS